MSSDEDLHEISDNDGIHGGNLRSEDGALKRRRFARACDLCRRKKIRCDAHEQAGHRCSHCTQVKAECTFVEDSKKRGPPKGYIEDLEARCKALELIVKTEAPHVDLNSRVGPAFTQDSWLAMYGSGRRRPTRAPLSVSSVSATPGVTSPSGIASPGVLPIPVPRSHSTMPAPASSIPRMSTTTTVESDSDSGDMTYDAIPVGAGPWSEHLHGSLNSTEGLHKRFHGKSSGVTLIQNAISMKQDVTGAECPSALRPMTLRAKFWSPNPWERIPSIPYTLETFVFPPEDLADQLISGAWERYLTSLPVLHRQTFDRERRSGLFRRNFDFARLYLMVCAIGSKGCSDPRVCFVDAQGKPEPSSAGWFYFAQVMSRQRPILVPIGLMDVQVSVLASLYLAGTSAPHAGWLYAGIGLRFAQDIGAHREKVYGADRPFENQMWKRAFWSLVLIDRMSSTRLGRSSGINDEDMDVQLPLEVDDEYWDEAKKEWKQPRDVKSTMTAFIHNLKLQSILAYALRTVYAINSAKIPLGFGGDDWEARTIAELDSSLNSWSDNLPDHLRYDPGMKDDIFRKQAAMLRITFLYVQITVHRKFIPILSRGKTESALSFPSLAICTNAARATAHILDTELQHGFPGSPLAHISAFTAGTVLLLGIWDAKRRHLRIDSNRQMEDVRRCLNILHTTEHQWHSAGRLYDILSELASLNESSVSAISPDNARKRTRDMEELHTATARATIADPDVISPKDFSEATSTSDASMSPPPIHSPPPISPLPHQPFGTSMPQSQTQFHLGTRQPNLAAMYSLNPGGVSYAPLDLNSSMPLAPAWDAYAAPGTGAMGLSTSQPWPQPSNGQSEPSPGTMFQGLLDILNQPVEPSPADTMQDIAASDASWLNLLAQSNMNQMY